MFQYVSWLYAHYAEYFIFMIQTFIYDFVQNLQYMLFFSEELTQIAGDPSRVIVRPDIESKAKQLLAPYLNCQTLIGAAFATVSTPSTTSTTTIPTTTTPFISGNTK